MVVGIGAPLPSRFEPTMDRYAAWLSSVISVHDSVDLVGQDWGGLLVLRVVSGRPSNVRSWTADSPDLDDGFVWHAGAQGWQDPQRAEQLQHWFTVAEIGERAAMLRRLGVDESHAEKIAPDLDATMASAMTVLYRSASDIGSEWGAGIRAIEIPGLCVVAGADQFRSPESVRALASRTNAERLELPSAGHFWMLDDPGAVAVGLRSFWASLSS